MKQIQAGKLLLKILFFVLLSVIEPLETKIQQRQYEARHTANGCTARNPSSPTSS